MYVSLIISLIDESLVYDSQYRPKQFCTTENHQRQIFCEERKFKRELIELANLVLKKITVHNVGGRSALHHFAQCGEDDPPHKKNVWGRDPPVPRAWLRQSVHAHL